MIGNKRDIATTWVDPDDAPELTDEWFQTAGQHKSGKLIQRGHPRLAEPGQRSAAQGRRDVSIRKRT